MRFVDDEGVHWLVRNVILNPNLEGFYLVRLDHGKTTDCKDGSMALAPSEYEALARSRGLKAVAPDVARPVSLVSSEGNRSRTSPPSTRDSGIGQDEVPAAQIFETEKIRVAHVPQK
jgi:hypothetical protein